MTKIQPKDEPKRKWYADIPPWEWAVGAFGLVLVLGVVGFLLYQGITNTQSPPDIVIHQEMVQPTQGGGYVVTIRVANHGGRTAARLTIEGELLEDGKTVETSSATLDYVPAGSERTAGLYFTRDPGQYELHLRPTGYAEP